MLSSRTILILLLSLIATRTTIARVGSRDVVRSSQQPYSHENGLVWRSLQEEVLGAGERDAEELTDEEFSSHDEGKEISSEKPWGAVIVASLIINLVSLSGLVIVVGGVATKRWCSNRKSNPNRRDWKFIDNLIPSFACGALIATSCFLIIPESLSMIGHFVEEEGESHGEEGDDYAHEEEDEIHEDKDAYIAWRFGVCFACGFLLPTISSLIFPHYHEPELCDSCESDLNGTNKEETTSLNRPATIQPPSSPSEKETTANTVESNCQCDDCEEDEQKPSEKETTASTVEHNCHCDNCHDHEEEEHKPSEKETTANTVEDNCHCDNCHDHKEDAHKEEGHHDPVENDDSIETVPDDAVETAPKPINYSLAASVLIGDFFHNFSDGILLGTAFSLCHRELALTVSVATVYHEIAQEIADFYLLTKHCNLKVPMALCLNFLGGLSVMLGGIFILSFDINSMVTGCVLALGSGVYMYIAAAECYPRAKASHRTLADKLLSLLAWAVGVVPIGLVLLNHGHCEA